MKKNIGVLFSTETTNIKTYLNFVESLGHNAILIYAFDETIRQNLDMLILVGGADVNPLRYNQKPTLLCGKPNLQLEFFDEVILPCYIRLSETQGLPIFGICRGFQTLNVVFGGSLLQNINQEYSGEERHKLVDELCLPEELKNLGYFPGFKESILPRPKEFTNFKVNSLHHQGFDYKTCSGQLQPIFFNKKFHNVEAFAHKTLPIVGVQWHPEEIYDKFSLATIELMLNKSH